MLPLRVAELVAPGPGDTERGDAKPELRPDGLFAGDGYLVLDSGQLTPDDGHEHNAAWLLAGLATRRFGPQVGQRLAELETDVDDQARFEMVCRLILDSASGDELLRSLDAEPR